MGTVGAGRKRSTKKERSTAEDEALNLIAREAEARLAAKRAARAEAREIRMKELERQQKELSDDDERMSVGSRGSVRVDDRDYLEKGSRAASALTAGTLTSLGGSSSRRGSGETAITVDAETSIREIKDALVEVEEKYRKAMVSNAQLDNEKNNLMYQVDTLKDSLMELEELLSESRRGFEDKVKDFEREKYAHTVLQFQFNEMKETLKQSEELLNEIRQLNIKQEGFVREISDLQETVEWKDKKIGALERQKEYTDAIRIERDELREEVVKLKDILKKHGIVLGPDLNINGEVGDADGSPSADPASQPAQDSQTPPTEGNSMLGHTEETQLRSGGEEEVDPDQHQEMFEEAKEKHLNSDTLCNAAGVSTLETSSEEQPIEEQQICLEEDKVTKMTEENGLSKNLNVDIHDQSITEAKDIIVCSPELQEIVKSPEENVPETETPKGGDLGETSDPDLGKTETKSSSVDTHMDDIRESSNNLFEEQENKQEDVEKSNLNNTESCHEQNVAQDVRKESLPDESVPAVSNTEPQQEPENTEEAENDEAEDIPSKSQPQGAAAASGKKKKRKRRGKKKGGVHEDKSQQKDETDKEKGKTEMDIESAARDNVPTTEPEIDGSVTETLNESRVDQVKNEQDGVEAVEPSETGSPNEALNESRMDRVTDEHNKEQTLEMEKVEAAEAVATTETCSHIETPKEVTVDNVTDDQNKEQSLENETEEAVEAVAPAHVETLKESRKDEPDEEQTLETEKVEEVGSITSPVPETNLSPSDLIDNSEVAGSTDGLDKECTTSVDNSKSETDISTNDNVIHASDVIDAAEDEVGSIDEMTSECTANNPEKTSETISKENTEAESHVPSNGDIAADESESTSNSESKDNTSVSLSSTDGFNDALKSLPGSESTAPENKVSDGDPEEATETVKDDEEPGAETEQESCSPSRDGDDSELKADGAEKEELNGDLKEPEGLVEPDSSSEKRSDSLVSASLSKIADAFATVKSLLETVVQAEHDDVESQTLQSEDQIDEPIAEASSESEEINTIDAINTPDSPKEATEIGSSIEQDLSTEESATVEDPEHKNQQSDTQELPEPNKDEPDDDSSQPTAQESDEEDDEEDNDEGRSFDFDDMDVEEAVATSLPKNPEQEEVEEEVKVMSDESNKGSSSNDNRQDEPVESIDEKCTVDGGNQVEALDTMSQDDQNSSEKEESVENVCVEQKNLPEEEVCVADESKAIVEEVQVLIVGELGVVAEDINQAMSLPVEEQSDPIRHESQGEDLELPKSAEQVASNKEPQQPGKDVKKNSKKGKGKGKEECKMS